MALVARGMEIVFPALDRGELKVKVLSLAFQFAAEEIKESPIAEPCHDPEITVPNVELAVTKRLVVVAVENFAVEGVVEPIGVLLIEPPEIVAFDEDKLLAVNNPLIVEVDKVAVPWMFQLSAAVLVTFVFDIVNTGVVDA